jgi:dTDP-glucose 4,6-dehydratase
MSKKVLLTGGAGFIGAHVAEYLLKHTDWEITFLDRLDFSGNLNRLSEIDCWEPGRARWKYHDLRAPVSPMLARQLGQHHIILHLAAMTHVDRAIQAPLEAVQDNVMGTAHILEYARVYGCERFLYFSTDEVFGPAPPGVQYREWDRYNSTNPYSATKAGGEELALAYANTYGVPVTITHTMNVFGERQHPEKFIPMVTQRVRDGQRVTIHADKTRTKAGSRFYIHARSVASAIHFLLNNAPPAATGGKFNIVGEVEVDNLALAEMIARAVGKPLDFEMIDFHSARPGHDLRYALDGSLMASLGWRPPGSFEDMLTETVLWSLANPRWLG